VDIAPSSGIGYAGSVVWHIEKGTVVVAMTRSRHFFFSGASTVLALVVAVVAASLMVLLLWSLPAQARSSTTGATIKVNTDQDEITPNDGKCSLREAIQNANTNAQTSPDCPAGSSTSED
jgi:CSLREA domain-containing protein